MSKVVTFYSPPTRKYTMHGTAVFSCSQYLFIVLYKRRYQLLSPNKSWPCKVCHQIHHKMPRTFVFWPLTSFVTSCSWSVGNPTSYSLYRL